MSNPLRVPLAVLLLFSSCVIAQDCCVTIAPSMSSISTPKGDFPAPLLKFGNPPQYPPSARAAGHQGTSIVTFTVGMDGTPHDIKVMRTLDTDLDESAVAAVSTWRYAISRKDAEIVETPGKVKIHFRLYDGDNRKLAELWDRSEANDPKADLELSKDYLEGNVVPQNEELGLQFLKMAADWNFPQAQFLMGERLYKNTNPPDYVAAYEWYALSKRSGGKQGEEMLPILAGQMTTEQLGEAETRIGYWPEEPPRPGH